MTRVPVRHLPGRPGLLRRIVRRLLGRRPPANEPVDLRYDPLAAEDDVCYFTPVRPRRPPCTCPHQDASEPDHDPWCPSRPGLHPDVARGLYAIIYGDNGATSREVTAARRWLAEHGIAPE